MKLDFADIIFRIIGAALALVFVAVAFWIVWHIGIDIGFWDDLKHGDGDY